MSSFGGQNVKYDLIQIDSMREIKLILEVGANKYRRGYWGEVENPEPKFFNSLVVSVLNNRSRRRIVTAPERGILFMTET